MDPMNLASSLNLAGGRGIGYRLYYFPIPILIVLGTLVIGFVILWRRTPSWPKRTAQVLSLQKSADYQGSRMCRIELKVNIPGREPYVAVTEKNLRSAEQAAVQPGETVQVRVIPTTRKVFGLYRHTEHRPRRPESCNVCGRSRLIWPASSRWP